MEDKRLLELLERWQSGAFSRADEQELQRLAASDEFRRDAVEGFWSDPSADHSERLNRLRRGIRKRSGMTKSVSMPQVMMAAAAALLLVLVAVWLLPSKQQTIELAQKDTPKPEASPPIASNLPEKTDTEAAERRSSTREFPAAAAPAADGPAAKPSAPAPAADPVGSMASAPPAPQKAAEEALAVQSERKESEYARLEDTLDDVDTQPGNMAAPAKSARDKAAQQVEAEETAKKRSKSSKPAQPAGGWDGFEDYLLKNARLTIPARENNVSGFVRLQFRLDSNSQPTNINILRSLGHGCDEEAIRLIKAYSWQRGDDNTLTVDVPFIR